MKLHNYDLVVMGNICFKFQPGRMCGLVAIIIYFFGIWILGFKSNLEQIRMCNDVIMWVEAYLPTVQRQGVPF